MKLSEFPIYFIAELKEYCRTTSDCRTMAYICRKELCECAQGYKPDDMNKTCIGGKFLQLFFIVVYEKIKKNKNIYEKEMCVRI